MTEYASFDDLNTAEELATEDVTLPNGKVVKVRGLSRFEYMLAGKDNDGDANKFENQFLRFGLVEPKLTVEQAEKWRKTANTKVVGPVSEAIRRLSGLGDDADKSDVS